MHLTCEDTVEMPVGMCSYSGDSLLRASCAAVARQLAAGLLPPLSAPLPAVVANAVLDELKADGLNGLTMRQFTSDNFSLTRADLSDCSFTFDALTVLAQHRLEELNLARFECSVQECLDFRKLLDELLTRSMHSLVSLSLPEMCLTNMNLLTRLPNLRCLAINGQLFFDQRYLDIISNELPLLRALDISHSSMIRSIAPLKKMKNLECLVMHRVHVADTKDEEDSPLEVFKQLTQLRVLDVSEQRTDYNSSSSSVPDHVELGAVILEEVARNGSWWPHLQSIDLAGNKISLDVDRGAQLLNDFIKQHPRLEQISILDTPLDRYPYEYPDASRPLRILNGGTRKQSLLALSAYWRKDREVFTAHALQGVYFLLQSRYDDFSQDDINMCVDGVVRAMAAHARDLAIQMAGSACLYHVCKLKRIMRLNPRQVRACVERCLDAAEGYPNMVQLQKNVWLTICNDYLLQTGHLDFFRTCSVALESMVNNRDSSVSRMTIAIVSIVAPKVRVHETRMLATDQRYVSFFVDTLKHHLGDLAQQRDNFAHFTLKFTLSALWNLTDECPSTCELFLKAGGVPVAFDVLKLCKGNRSIQTKVLGLLNNIAEVDGVKDALIKPRYLRPIMELLDAYPYQEGDRVDVSYFAAGILSNLVWDSEWLEAPSSEEINNVLSFTVSSWPRSQSSMVSYRSFSPFIHLIDRYEARGAQLWAIWAINHVIMVDKDGRYPQMLAEQGGIRKMRRVAKDEDASEVARRMAKEVLDACAAEGY